MDITLGLLEYYLLIQILSSIALFPYFKSAGIESWKAFVPFLKTWIVLDKTERSKWQMILVYVPVVNHVMAIIMAYEFMHCFNKRKWSDILLTIPTLGLYMAYIGFSDKKLKWVGKNEVQMKAQLGDWIPSILFAVVAATTIRAFSFEAYTIPTPSMEKSLMVGDYLFVSKAHYGVRTPMTPVAIPLMHATIPFTEIPSFTAAVQLPYFRLPAFQDVQRNESFVFNFPGEAENPIDKKQNYVKRCVGVAGDTLSVIDGYVHIKGQEESVENRDRYNGQFRYLVKVGPQFSLGNREIKEKFGIDAGHRDIGIDDEGNYIINATDEVIEQIAKRPGVKEVMRLVVPKLKTPMDSTLPPYYKTYIRGNHSNSLYPQGQISVHGDKVKFDWSLDQYGPIYIPKKGESIEFTEENYWLYKQVISKYEGHTLDMTVDGFVLDGELADSYTFEENYYWAMGDNRHNSLDSRIWGFVPEKYIVGKPVFIWMSLDKFESGFDKIRTDRVFTTVHGTGERVSYFWYVMALFILNYLYRVFIKKKKGPKTPKPSSK